MLVSLLDVLRIVLRTILRTVLGTVSHIALRTVLRTVLLAILRTILQLVYFIQHIFIITLHLTWFMLPHNFIHYIIYHLSPIIFSMIQFIIILHYIRVHKYMIELTIIEQHVKITQQLYLFTLTLFIIITYRRTIITTKVLGNSSNLLHSV